MSSKAAEAGTSHLTITSAPAAVHPGWVRITHWINVVAMFMMITSGWRMYDASPLFGFMIPPAVTIGDGLGGLTGALLSHFPAMWLLVINGISYLTCGIGSGRFRRKLLPIRPGEVVRDLRAALTGRLSHGDLSVYNAVQRLVIASGIVSLLSGIAIWKPVQAQEHRSQELG
jgi:thiosulfate reductase cytochrome b subunit